MEKSLGILGESLGLVGEIFEAHYTGDQDKKVVLNEFFAISYKKECGDIPGDDGCLMDEARETLMLTGTAFPMGPEHMDRAWNDYVSLMDKYKYKYKSRDSVLGF